MEEIWRPVEGYSNYVVSNFGRVKTVARTIRRVLKSGGLSIPQFLPEKILSPCVTTNKLYHAVSLRNDGGKKTIKLHRIVARAFVDGYDPELDVLHLDDNGFNNRFDNLRWGTHQDNMDDKCAKGRQTRGSENGPAVLTEEDVLEIVRRKREGATLRGLAAEYGVSPSTINLIIVGENWSHITGIPKRIPKPRNRKKKNVDRENQDCASRSTQSTQHVGSYAADNVAG